LASEYYVYLLRCADNSLYCGITNDVERRVAQHNAGTGAKYTRAAKRLPVFLETACGPMDKGAALSLEYQVKQLPAREKVEFLREQEMDLDSPDGPAPR